MQNSEYSTDNKHFIRHGVADAIHRHGGDADAIRRPLSAFAHRALTFTVPAGVLAFWGGLWMAVRRYPAEYDWRYITMSSLLYPDRNPDGYRWAWLGLMLCALAGLHWTVVLAGKGRGDAPRPIYIWALGAGYVCMVGCAVPARLLLFPRGHEMLAVGAFLGVCTGITLNAFAAGKRSAAPRFGSPRLQGGVLAGIALSPIVLTALAEAYLAYALPALPWVSLGWRARGVPVCLSLAFWEWLACAIFSAYMVILSRLCASQ
jgi:hypothetical protein